LEGAEILVLKSDHTHLKREVSDRSGRVQLEEMTPEPVTLFGARPGFDHYYEANRKLLDGFRIQMHSHAGGGSIIIPDRTGYIPGLEGRLNLILDDQNRTYLYADNIAIDGGKAQPVVFVIPASLRVKDRHGNAFQLGIVAIIGSSSLVDYTYGTPSAGSKSSKAAVDLAPGGRKFTSKSPRELLAFYKNLTSLQADSLIAPFKGLWIRVAGTVETVVDAGGGGAQVMLTDHEGVTCSCTFEKQWRETLSRLSQNEQINVSGKISDGQNGTNLYLMDCELLQSQEDKR
jgi:hypothetical protein